jgi:CBS domain-containing protein
MKVEDVMTRTPACCTPSTSLQTVARLMVTNDCGAIPVVEESESMRLVGIVTDRDLIVHSIARGRNPLGMTANDCMSGSVVSVGIDASAEECCDLMEYHQVRRIPVVDEHGRCCGMVAQADIAERLSERKAGEVVKEVSQRNENFPRPI